MPWNWMQLMDHAADYQVQSAVGPGEMILEAARDEIQGMFDGLMQQVP